MRLLKDKIRFARAWAGAGGWGLGRGGYSEGVDCSSAGVFRVQVPVETHYHLRYMRCVIGQPSAARITSTRIIVSSEIPALLPRLTSSLKRLSSTAVLSRRGPNTGRGKAESQADLHLNAHVAIRFTLSTAGAASLDTAEATVSREQ